MTALQSGSGSMWPWQSCSKGGMKACTGRALCMCEQDEVTADAGSRYAGGTGTCAPQRADPQPVRAPIDNDVRDPS